MAPKKKQREESRKRMQKTIEKRTAAGMKAVTVVLSAKAFERLVRMKEELGGTYSVVIEKALRDYSSTSRTDHLAVRPISLEPRSKKAAFKRGDRVRVNNPFSRYHGRILTVDSFTEPFGVVRGTIEGASANFHADYLEPLVGSSA